MNGPVHDGRGGFGHFGGYRRGRLSSLTWAWTWAFLAFGEGASPLQDELKPGLVGEWFQLDEAIEDFPSVEGKKPKLRRVDKKIDWDSTGDEFAGSGMSEHFYVRWTGILRVPKSGKYVFYTESDDGSRLWLKGKKVVDNGGLHAMEEKSGEIELEAGDVEIKLDLFENEGDVGLKLLWEGPEISKQIVPAGALFHKKDDDLDKEK